MIKNYVYLRCKYTTTKGVCQEVCEIFFNIDSQFNTKYFNN